MKTAIALWCIVAVGCKQNPVIQQSSGYATMTVSTSEKTLSNNYSASIRGKQDIDIYPQVSGFITKLCVAEGESVKKGQVLFIIDQVPYEAALNTAIANVEAAKASVATAQLTYESKQELYKNKVVSEFDLKTAYNTLLSAKAQLAQAEAQEVNARNNLSYTEVKSPVDGVASMLPYRVGALVSSSITTPLTTVSDDREVYAYFSMTENQILSLVSQSGTLEKALEEMPEVDLQLSNGQAYAHKGKLEAISGTIEAGPGVISVRATFPNPEQMLRNGSSGEVIFPYNKENVIIIPQEATFEVQDKVFAYKVVDGKATSTQLQVYPIDNGKEYVVEKGLEKGDIIIAEGAGLIQEGTVVKTAK